MLLNSNIKFQGCSFIPRCLSFSTFLRILHRILCWYRKLPSLCLDTITLLFCCCCRCCCCCWLGYTYYTQGLYLAHAQRSFLMGIENTYPQNIEYIFSNTQYIFSCIYHILDYNNIPIKLWRCKLKHCNLQCCTQ